MSKILGITDRILVVDAETSSPVDLKKEGQYRYWEHPETETLMLGYKDLHSGISGLTDFKVSAALSGYPDALPSHIVDAIKAPPEECLLAAANAPFDQAALRQLGYDTPDEKWIDVLVMAYVLGFAGRLDDVLKASPLNVTKNPEGTRLITLFSVQRKPWHEHPEKWDKFRDYCRHDASVEAKLLEWCLKYLDTKTLRETAQTAHRQNIIYRRINRRGIPVDLAAVRKAQALKDAEFDSLLERMRTSTGLDNPNSTAQLLAWCNQQPSISARYPMPNLQKATVRDTLLEIDPLTTLATVLTLRQEIGKTSVKKFDALARATSDDGRLRGGWQFYGASRTGRVAGRTLNPANLPRPQVEHPEEIAEWLASPGTDREILTRLFPEKPLLDTLGSTVRACLKAPPGKRWCVADLTSIESVGAAWLAGCQSILDIFHAGRDTYKTFAAAAEGIPYEEVTKAQRTFYKPPVLAGAYQISGASLVDYAAGMGVEMSEDEGYRLITSFREEYHEIPHYWRQLVDAAANAVKRPGQTYYAKAVKSWKDDEDVHGRKWKIYTYKDWPYVAYRVFGDFLLCRIPSGRVLSYYKPELKDIEITPRRGEPFTVRDSLHYMGNNQKLPGARWMQINASGGMMLENVTQALCRDVLWNGLEQAEADPELETVGDVYDELLTITPTARPDATLKRLVGYMTSPLPWADDSFFLGADGYTSTRYRKD